MFSGGHSGGVTPVPIPNTEVKPASADGTWGASPWESRSPPDSFSKKAPHKGSLLLFPGTVPAMVPPRRSPSDPRPGPRRASGPKPAAGRAGGVARSTGGGRKGARPEPERKLPPTWGKVARSGARVVRPAPGREDVEPERRDRGRPPEWQPELWTSERVEAKPQPPAKAAAPPAAGRRARKVPKV